MTAPTNTGVVVLRCADCAARSTADPKHLPNLLAAGPWRCDTCKEPTQ